MGLAEALDAGQFSLLYQPIVELETQRVAAAEALLRWRHPTRGDTSPDVFIPIAESSGLIVPIGRWVLNQACAQCAAWHRNGHSLGVSVNVSARQFERPEFVDEVRAALADNALDAAWLTLEITETALMNRPVATEELLVELKTLGVQIAVDDFGTGYSSLGYLRQFPIDSLKLDRSFITGLARSGEANALAHTLIQLGKTLGLRTVAEGVEAYTQLCHLQLEGCELAQGYLFARPLTPESLELYLRRDPSPTRTSAIAAPSANS
jgi:EAL domain-containing protein (putative c-di-GMP-specific phosphodiesterase class I)